MFDPGLLRAARLAKGWSLSQFAELVGIDPAQLSRYETGVIYPSLRTLGRLASALGLPAGSFFVA